MDTSWLHLSGFGGGREREIPVGLGWEDEERESGKRGRRLFITLDGHGRERERRKLSISTHAFLGKLAKLLRTVIGPQPAAVTAKGYPPKKRRRGLLISPYSSCRFLFLSTPRNQEFPFILVLL